VILTEEGTVLHAPLAELKPETTRSAGVDAVQDAQVADFAERLCSIGSKSSTSTTVGNGKFIPYSEHGSGGARERKVPFDFAQGMALDFARMTGL
jgi:hypothetical protein